MFAILPHFPKTPHLPWKPNLSDGDVVAEDSECAGVFDSNDVVIQEKLDGASVGFGYENEHPLIRNREHYLNKGFVGRTPAKKQFASIWTYYYNNKDRFAKLFDLGTFSVYGEWMIMQHGIHYTRLPDWFIAYDIWDWQTTQFLAFDRAQEILAECGFQMPKVLHRGTVGDYRHLEAMTQENAQWADSKVEGVYVRVSGAQNLRNRFKLVREDFVQGALWDKKEVKRNSIQEKIKQDA